MDFFVKEYTDCLRQVFVNVAADEVNDEFKKALSDLQKKVSLPGYRVGKAPTDLIEKMHSEELMRNIINSVVVGVVDKLYQDGVRLFSEPRFNPLSGLTRDNPFSFSIVFDAAPRVIENFNPESMTVEFEEYFYDDKMMETSIQKELKSLETVNGKAESGDTVTVKALNAELKGTDDPVLETEMVKALIGKKAGDKVKLSFADLGSYVADFLGKVKGDLEAEVVKVERPAAQAVTDEFVSTLTPFKTAEDYKKAMKNRFDRMLEEFNQAAKKNALMLSISKTAKVEFPKSIYIRDFRREVGRYIQNNFFLSEIPLTEILEDKKIRDEFAAYPDRMKDNLTFFFAINEYADQNHIEPSRAIVEKIAMAHAEEQEMSLDDYKQKATKDEWNTVMESAKFETALEVLVGQVKFKAKGKKPLIQSK